MINFCIRKKTRKINVNDTVTVQICSIPERLPLLPKVIESLLPQIDQIFIVLNGYIKVPDVLNTYTNSKVFISCSDNSMTDAEKFRDIELRRGYLFTCDDDLEYPPNYVRYMISKIEEYNRKAIISLHGRKLKPPPIISYYNDHIEYYHFMQNVKKDYVVDVGGTGVTAWHSDTIKISFSDFQKPSMADIFFGLQARKQRVKIIVAKHKATFIKYLNPELHGKTIWDTENSNDKIQTQIINENF